ncbi:Potassium transporter 5 [Hibiscus syriacus]|uniref:Potassium transporter n=1 Tax=Hibiscus syriacus TaxID=106335 RepID=A0A6A3AG45_HIBSY|nr:Potassium transporter 5 [Hibiscus syriacus]
MSTVSDDPIVETDHHEEVSDQRQNLFDKLSRIDSLDVESAKVLDRHGRASRAWGWSAILQLAFQSLGVIYGDIGTSPLYVYARGTFALYSLICRYAKVGLIPSQQAEDADVSNFQLDLPTKRLKRASKLKSTLENSNFAKIFLLIITMLGTSMVIGDGVLTPCISVLSAVGGIREAKSSLSEGTIVWTSAAILVCLFMVQRFGTDKVGYTFAPIICIWFAFIGGIGVYNFIKFDPTVVKAINPNYIVDYFKRNKKDAWVSLGGVVLAITGTEAMFADVGHFTVRSVQISMCTVTYPALILAYTGQASFLRKHEDLVSDTFYKSIPNGIYWPMFVIAVAAAIIASQAMISGTFSIIQQSLALGCFPRVKVVHTSTKYEGQVYIPEVNYLLMLACVAVTAGFRTTQKIGNAYGIAVVFVMTLTSSLLVLIMIMIWKTSILLIIAYVIVIGSVELLYLSSVLYKFDQGGYLPLAFAAFIVTVMCIWSNVYQRKYHYELDHKVSPQKFKEIATNTCFSRIPGLAMFYSELVHGIPPIFKHYLENVSALHSVLVFVSIKSLPISKVPVEERFRFRRVEPRELYVFRCAARYGYTDVHNEGDGRPGCREKDDIASENGENMNENGGEISSNGWLEDVEMVEKAREAGVVHLVGENEVIAVKGAGIGKKILINYAYNFIKRNLRQTDKVFEIPHKRLLKVGMTYEL